jgi:hypothetical protein
LIQQAIEWNTGHFLLWLELGRCQQALGLTGAATTSLKRARELNPQSDAVRAALLKVSKTGLRLRLSGWCRKLLGK